MSKYSLLQRPKKFKSLTMPKKLKGGPLGIFQHPFRRKTPKNEGETLWWKKISKSRTMPKKN